MLAPRNQLLEDFFAIGSREIMNLHMIGFANACVDVCQGITLVNSPSRVLRDITRPKIVVFGCTEE